MAVCANVFRAAQGVRSHLERTVLRRHDLSWTGFATLFTIWVWGREEIRALADSTGVARPTISGVADTLERRGLVRREGHETDRRLCRVALTGEGERLIEALFPRVQRRRVRPDGRPGPGRAGHAGPAAAPGRPRRPGAPAAVSSRPPPGARPRSRASPCRPTTSSAAGASRAPTGGPSRCARRWTGTGGWPTSRPAAGPRSTRPWRPRAPPSRRGPRSAPRAGTRSSRASPTPSAAAVPDLAAVETVDNGSLLEAMRLRVLPRGANNLRFFADFAVERLAEPPRTLPGGERNARPPRPGRRGRRLHALERAVHARHLARRARAGRGQHRRPQAAGVGAADLLACSATSPLEAGLPPGVLNVVHGTGAEAGAPLTGHPDVDRVAFTGSPATARTVYRDAAAQLTPVSFELGGKSPFVVLDDADLDAAAATAAYQYDNSGQVCLAGTRLLVQRADPRRRSWSASGARVDAIRVGDPREEGTTYGPLIHPVALERVTTATSRRALDAGRHAGLRRRAARRPLLPADALHRRARRRRAPAPGGLRPRPGAAALRRRRGGGPRWPTPPTSAWPPRSTRARRSAPTRAQRADQRRHGVGQLLLRPRPRDAVRRARRTRASAARAATTRSTSTATSRRSASARRSTGRAAEPWSGPSTTPRVRTADVDEAAGRYGRLLGLTGGARATPGARCCAAPTRTSASTSCRPAPPRPGVEFVAYELRARDDAGAGRRPAGRARRRRRRRSTSPSAAAGLRLQDPAGNGVALLERVLPGGPHPGRLPPHGRAARLPPARASST